MSAGNGRQSCDRSAGFPEQEGQSRKPSTAHSVSCEASRRSSSIQNDYGAVATSLRTGAASTPEGLQQGGRAAARECYQAGAPKIPPWCLRPNSVDRQDIHLAARGGRSRGSGQVSSGAKRSCRVASSSIVSAAPPTASKRASANACLRACMLRIFSSTVPAATSR